MKDDLHHLRHPETGGTGILTQEQINYRQTGTMLHYINATAEVAISTIRDMQGREPMNDEAVKALKSFLDGITSTIHDEVARYQQQLRDQHTETIQRIESLQAQLQQARPYIPWKKRIWS